MTARPLAVLALLLCSGCGAELASTAATPAPRAATPSPACQTPPRKPRTSTAAPSQPLLDALAILRRPKAADDTPPAAALRDTTGDGLMLDAARRVSDDRWIVPTENLYPPLEIPEACLRAMPPKERRAARAEIERSRKRPPTEGVQFVRNRVGYGYSWTTEDVLAGRAFRIQGCAGEMHDRIAITGLVPDAVTQVTVTARDGAILQATPQQNLVTLEQPRPDGPSGLPAHITSTTSAQPLEYAIDPRITRHLDQPCEPPSRNSIGQRREPPTKLKSPPGARIELQTRRWQPEDRGPLVAGATYEQDGRRCLLIASEQRLRQGKPTHRFCVADARLRAERFIVRATRLPSGDVVLEGFADPDQVAWITVERSIGPGAFLLPPARRSGAFFVAIAGRHSNGGSFKLHAALRGKPVRYTGLRTVRLKPSP